jgi:hypothetical protein
MQLQRPEIPPPVLATKSFPVPFWITPFAKLYQITDAFAAVYVAENRYEILNERENNPLQKNFMMTDFSYMQTISHSAALPPAEIF